MHCTSEQLMTEGWHTRGDWSLRPVPAPSFLKSLHEGTGRKDLFLEQFAGSVLRKKSQGLVPKFQTGFTTVFVDTRLWKTKHPRKRFQNFLQSCVLSTDRIKIHQSQPLVRPSDLSRLSRLLETFPRVLLFSKVAYQRKRR